MNKITLLLTAFLISNLTFAQDEGSGTITFNFATDVPIEATATSLFAGGAHVYQISGTTNEAIPFGPWYLSETLGESNEILLDDIFLSKNPNSSLNLFIKANDGDEVTTLVYDINGKLISSPQPYNKDNGVVHIYDPMVNVSDGLYFVNVTVGSKKHNLKFIKSGDDNGPITLATTTFNKLVKNNSFNRSVMANNYIITWNNSFDFYGGSHSVEVMESINNSFVTNTTSVVGTENGNFAISTELNGSGYENTTIIATNTVEVDSTYTISTPTSLGVFWKAYVSNSNNPTSYEIIITSNDDDPDFLETTVNYDIFQDVSGEVNGVKSVALNPIPNEQDITMVVRDYQSLTATEGVTVQMINDVDDTVMNTRITDVNGEVLFDNVGGGTEVYFKHSKTGYFTKTNGRFSPYMVPTVNHISEMDTILNVTAIPKYNYSNGTPATAAQLDSYIPNKYNPEFLHGHWYSNTGGNAIINADFEEMVALVGMSGAFIETDNPNLEPTQEIINNYNPYTGSPEYAGQVGAFVTNPSAGGSTGAYIREYAPGILYTINTWVFDLGPTKTLRMHEGFQALGFRLVDQNAITPQTVMDSTSPSPFSIYDENMITVTILGRNHFVFSDSEGRPMEYAYTTDIEE